MISTLRKPKIEISAQDLIKLPAAMPKYGMLRLKKRKYSLGKWPFKFVVLVNGSFYIYTSEAAKSPTSKYSLEGYNWVRRTEAKGHHEWCFSIFPATPNGPLKTKTFACVSDSERLAWMKVVKEQLHKANKVPKRESDITEKLRSLTLSNDPDIDGYTYVEELVYGTSQGISSLNDANDDSDTDASEEDSFVVKKKSRSYSLPTNSLSYDVTAGLSNIARVVRPRETISESDGQPYETCDDIFLPETSVAVSRPRRELPRPPSDPPLKPPRYSEVMSRYATDEGDGVEDHDNPKPEGDYANLRSLQEETAVDDYDVLPSSPQLSLESLCTIYDLNPDRDSLIRRIRSKEPGTYLIRNSRQESYKVLTFVANEADVKELKINGQPDGLTLDSTKHFQTLDELLYHYSHVEPVPYSPGLFLKRGIHQVL